MVRRVFIRIAGSLSLIAIAYNFSSLLELARRIQGRLIKPEKIPPANKRAEARINPAGETVSLELALNSRCTSDYNGRQEIFHWGLFDPQKRLMPEDVQRLVQRVQIPRFTDGLLEIKAEQNMLYFLMANEVNDIKRSWMMIESGMQQQVVCLLCAAFGVGMVFKSLGDDGTSISDSIYSNTRMKLDAMRPSYNGSYWCVSAPEGWRPWLKGNLPAPTRKGKAPLTNLISSLGQTRPPKNKSATIDEISQLLWAARGRTPHYYKSKPWGMTIPVSRGNQNVTNISLLHANRLFRYSNWKRGRPTHGLEKVHDLKNDPYLSKDENIEPDHNCHIILSRNEKSGRALWEIGYQLINIILQAKAFEISLRTYLVDNIKRKQLRSLGISDAWAITSMQMEYLPIVKKQINREQVV